ncbi:MAG: hypothetical protein E7655_06260 [Ruminococcaceae bacterium]|nr:hypothetical protein [Oscillospiraceae bacterium]
MYYKKNGSPALSDELFRNPTCEYRGTPFWGWNDTLSKERLTRQIIGFKEMGFGGYHMHVRTGFRTKYLSDEFFEYIKHCVSEAEKQDMLAYLYDEDRWPSGFAGGLVTAPNPLFRQRYLLMTARDRSDDAPHEQAVAEGKHIFLGAFRIRLNGDGIMTSFEKVPRGSGDPDVRYFFCMCQECNQVRYNHTCYVDTLSKPAIDEFIRITYDAYAREVGDQFGKRCPSIFTDEPRLVKSRYLPSAESKNDALLAFTHDFCATFEAQYGFSLQDNLPYLYFEGENGAHIRTRYCYYDHLSERFATAFMDNVSDWSASHGLLQTGHLMAEGSLGQQCAEVGEAMRCYRKMGMIGMDLLCDRHEFSTAKQCQSVLHQTGREAMMSELYGVTNWDFDFRHHKYQGDWQACMGVNVRVPHISWYSMHGEAKRDYPASINYQSPWYKEYPYIEDHYARVNTAMTRGKPVCSIGVIHPIESQWLLCGSLAETKDMRDEQDSSFLSTVDWLLESSLDFEFIAESLLPELHRESEKGFVMGEMCYDAVLVPCLRTIRSTTVEALTRFVRRGGKVIFMGGCPDYVDAKREGLAELSALYSASVAIPTSRPKLVQALKDVRTVEIRVEGGGLTDNLCYSLREDNGTKWMFVAQLKQPHLFDKVISQNIKITVDGLYDVKLYDTLSGEITDAEYACSDGTTRVYRTVYDNDSLLLHFIPTAEPKKRIRTAPKTQVFRTDVRDYLSYKRHEPNVLLLDMAHFSLDGEPFSEREEILRIDDRLRTRLNYEKRQTYIVQPYLLDHLPEDHTLSLNFTFRSDIEYEGAQLALEEPEKCRLLFNGQPISNTPIGWYVDEDIKTVALPKIVKGENVITLTRAFGEKTDIEACYLLGEFGVKVNGCISTLIANAEKITFGSIVGQGMPFYAGNIDYITEIDLPEDGDLVCETTMYRGAMVKVTLDGGESHSSVFSPYKVTFRNVKKGKHKVIYTNFGMRYNTFAGIHNLRSYNRTDNFDPNFWRSKDSLWSYEYIFKDFGIMKSPEMSLLK